MGHWKFTDITDNWGETVGEVSDVSGCGSPFPTRARTRLFIGEVVELKTGRDGLKIWGRWITDITDTTDMRRRCRGALGEWL